MPKKRIRHLLSPLALCALSLSAETDPAPSLASVSHIEGKGIGYKHGYTSLDLFFSKNTGDGIPFVDLRGHVFDDGKMAGNIGIGYRHLFQNMTLGGNLFYDFRTTKRFNINQVGVGLEALAKSWGVRVNGYIPVGRQASNWYGHGFGGFKEHHLYVRRKQEFAMAGVDGEAGYYTDQTKNFRFYGGAGPYYYEGKGKQAFGGRARVDVSYKNYVNLEFTASYDSFFKDIYQGQITFTLPIGKMRETCKPVYNSYVEPVLRNEIIVEGDHHEKFLAINPVTGEPYFFLFVDNTSHSNGTFESPYNLLSLAFDNSNSHDIIYVYPGDGTTTGLTTDVGFALQDGQMLLGAGFTYDLSTTAGNVTIPPQASGYPHIATSTDSINVITPTNQNTIAGLRISLDSTSSNGIYNNSPTSDQTIFNNIIECNGSNADSECINLTDFIGDLVIENNTLEGGTAGMNGIVVRVNSRSSKNSNISISNNSVSSFTDNAVSFTSDSIFTVYTNMNNNFVSDASTGLIAQNSNTGTAIYHVHSNTMSNLASINSSFVQFSSGGTTCLQFQDNTATGSGVYSITANSPGTFNLEPFIRNVPDTYNTLGSGTVTDVPQGTCR